MHLKYMDCISLYTGLYTVVLTEQHFEDEHFSRAFAALTKHHEVGVAAEVQRLDVHGEFRRENLEAPVVAHLPALEHVVEGARRHCVAGIADLDECHLNTTNTN